MIRMARRRKRRLSKQAEAFISRHIRTHRRKYRMPMTQAVAAAYAEARHKGYKIPRRRRQ